MTLGVDCMLGSHMLEILWADPHHILQMSGGGGTEGHRMWPSCPGMLRAKGCVGWLRKAGVEEPVPAVLAIMRDAAVAAHARSAHYKGGSS